MKARFVRELTREERGALQTGQRSSHLFTVRRCQIVLASSRGRNASRIAESVGCSIQAVFNVLRAFEQCGVAALTMRSRRPKSAAKVSDAARSEQLRALLHQSPRDFGKPTSVWTLELAAEVCFERGRTPRASRTKRSATPSTGSAWAGSAPRTGLPAPTPSTRGKRTTRSANGLGQAPGGVGRGLRRRSLVVALGPAGASHLGRGGLAAPREGATT